MGARRENIYMVDRQGVVHTGRKDLNSYKFAFANQTDKRTLDDAMRDADVFIGVSGANLVSADMIKSMAPNPLVFALSNPDPEISPAEARAARKDLIMATGRSDYPNQVNNVLGFPYIFRGALDVRARRINQEMLIAAVNAIATIAKEPVLPEVLAAYPDITTLNFGADYIIPKPMDPRLRERVAAAVAAAAVSTGVARLPYPKHYPQIL
jgi:malate dehydrogenase (oxaloacetate-decarboxylating)(NADP+)